jgi:hypothetical protein
MIPGLPGAIAGLIGGLATGGKKVPKYKKVPGLFDEAGRKANAEKLTRFYMSLLSKDYQPMTPEEIRAQLGMQRARTSADAQMGRMRAQERSIGMGLGSRSGVLAKTMDEIDRAELDANRASYYGLLSELGKMRPQLQLSGAGGLGGLTLADLQHASAEQKAAWQASAQRALTPSRLEAALAGGAYGFLGSTPPAQQPAPNIMGGGGSFFPSFGGSASAMPAYAANTMAGGFPTFGTTIGNTQPPQLTLGGGYNSATQGIATPSYVSPNYNFRPSFGR